MPLKPLDMLNRIGWQRSDAETMANWGNPQIPMEASETDGQTFRMPLPRWAPGEFEEWKQAKMTGMPTTYGANADRNFRARKIKAAGQQLVNPALMALMQGIR